MLEEQVNLSIRDILYIERYNTGDGYRSIANRLGLTRDYVRYYLQDDGVVITNNKRSKSHRKDRAGTNKRVIWEILRRVGCEVCGEKNPLVLEFDHINPEDKSAEMTSLISKGAGLERLLDELEKCRIVCANCHRIHTFEQAKSWRWEMYKKRENVSHD